MNEEFPQPAVPEVSLESAGELVQPEELKTSINLDRNLPLDAGIEFNPSHFYRMIGESGFNDFVANGKIRPAPNSKQEYDKSYYYKGHPLKRYAKGEVDYFVEVKPSGGLFEGSVGTYPSSVRDAVKSEDEIRVYKYTKGSGSELVFDGFKTDQNVEAQLLEKPNMEE